MIKKKYAGRGIEHQGELTDEHNGDGMLQIKGVGHTRWVPDLASVNPYRHSGYQSGRNDWDEFEVLGRAVPDEWLMSFSLKVYEDGFIRPASVGGSTKFKSKGEAIDVAERWVAEGGPGIQLQSNEETQRKKREANSSHMLSKLLRSLSGLTETALVKLSEAALRTITTRIENADKEAAKLVAKKEKAAAKAMKLAEKSAKQKLSSDKKAEREAEKARKQAEKDAKLAAKQATVQAST